ncbi:MAG: hypothetical protein GY711_10025 [bacterium]|nr:hypothetical protein [bacterium]
MRLLAPVVAGAACTAAVTVLLLRDPPISSQPTPAAPDSTGLAGELAELRARNAALEQRVQRLEDDVAWLRAQASRREPVAAESARSDAAQEAAPDRIEPLRAIAMDKGASTLERVAATARLTSRPRCTSQT